ncbi:MAG: LysR family transcriptional regulator [Clostridia bacterium]|nr:LysR family transcriptional regulator [Clostridia bacterium]
MDIKQLKTFLSIARLQSFTLTAQKLNYAQSTVTTQIQLLEKEFGVKLFDRLGQNITLTPDGKKLLPFAEQIVKLSNEAKNVMDNSNEPNGTLSIGAVESLCVMRLPKLLKEYRSRYPNVEIALRFGNCNEFLRSLKENTLDIAFFLEKKIDQEEFVTEIQFPEPMVILSSPEHPLARAGSVYPKDLNNQSFILTEAGCGYRALFENMLTRYSIRPHSIIETGNVQAIKQLAISGLGITLLPLVAVEEECFQQRLVKLNWKGPDFEILTQVLYHRNKWISAPLKAFIELIHEIKL